MPIIYKITSSKVDHVRVVFELPASLWAQSAYVGGTHIELIRPDAGGSLLFELVGSVAVVSASALPSPTP